MRGRLPDKAPGGRVRLSGVFVIGLLCGACDFAPGSGRAELDLGGETVQLPAGVQLHEVAFEAGPGGTERAAPARVEARPGDVVRFAPVAPGTHAVGFRLELLSASQRDFLERTGQAVSPPLMDSAAWVVSLEGAPTGEYPFLCITHEAEGSTFVGS